MEYNISRYEQNKDHEGNITSIFLAVSIQDGEEGTYYEHWLSSEDRDLVLLDEANLKPILEKCFAEAELKLENHIATRPQPSNYPLKEEERKEVIEKLHKVEDIKIAKDKIVADKLAKELEAEVIEEPVIEEVIK